MMLFPLLLVTICSCAHSEQTFSQSAQEFVIKTELLATFGSNSLEKLQNVADNIEDYLKHGARVGAVVALAASRMRFMKETDEYNTLYILHHEWINFLDKNIPSAPNFGPSIAIRAYRKEYSKKIRAPKAEWKRHFETVTHPEKMYGAERFKEMCRSQTFNSAIGNGIERIFLLDNYLPDEKDFDIILQIQQAFDRETAKSLPEDYITLKHDILAIVADLPPMYIDELLRLLTNPRINVTNMASSSLVMGLVAQTSWIRPFHMFYHGSDQRMAPLMTLVEQLALDILQEEAMTALSMNTSFADMYTELVLARIGISAAKRELRRQQIPATELNSTALRVEQIFQERSIDSVSYQVLIVPTSAMGDWWSVRNQNPENYANFTTVTSLDVHVFRFMSNEQNRTDKATKWIKANREAIIDLLRRSVSNSVEEVMNTLNEVPTTKRIFELYRSVILFHRRSLLKSRSEIYYGLAPSENDFELIEYSENGFFAHNWKLFMFL